MISHSFTFAGPCEGLTNWKRVDVSDDELLIGLLRVNNRPLSSGFDILPAEGTYLIPLQSLEDLLQFGWTISSTYAEFESNKSNEIERYCEFNIPLTASTSLESQQLLWTQDDFDIYIDIRAIPILIGGSVEFNFELQQLQIQTDSFIPSMEDNQGVQVPSFTAYDEDMPDRVIVDKYRISTPPIVNYRLSTSYNSKKKNTRLTTNLNGFFDLAHHATELRVNSTNGNTRQFIRMSKNLDITGEDEAINFLRYEIGDIQLQSDELIYRAKQAAGISIFNFDPNYSNSFSQVTIEETILPGWRAQLFRNGQFIDETFTGDDNRVVFEDIATFYGSNLFEIKLFGPEGQQEVRKQTLNVGNEQLSPGNVNYHFNISDSSIRTVDSNVDESSYDKNVSGLLSYGLTPYATIEGSVHTLSGLDTRKEYISSAFYLNLEHSALKTQIVKDLNAGSALFTGITSNFSRNLKANFNLRHFDNFSSDAYQASQNLKSEMRLRLNGRSDSFGGFGWNTNILHRRFTAKDSTSTLTLGLNKNLLGGTFSSSFSHNSISQDERLLHRLYWSKNLSGWRVSNSLEWLPIDSQRIRNYNTNIRWPQGYETFNETRVQYRANQKDKFSLSHKFNWRRDEFNLQLGATMDNGGHWSVNFGISGDIEYNPFSRSTDFYRSRGSSVANIQAFAFLDKNRNDVFDGDDSALPEVNITGNQGWKYKHTNEYGKVQLSTNSRSQSLQIDEATLPDPFMQPVDKLVVINTHKGGINHVNLPVVTFSDIEGSIFQIGENMSRGAGGVNLEFVNENHEVLLTTQTEVDGYFFVSGLPPGNYLLRIDPKYLASNGLVESDGQVIIFAPNEGDSLRLDDILLREASSLQTSTNVDKIASAE